MNTQQVQAQLKGFREQRIELEQKIAAAAQELFAMLSKELFAKHPALGAFRWDQHTPYFNDGEECVFRSYHEYAECEPAEGFTDESPEFTVAEEAVRAFLKLFEDDDMEQMFGDHVSIVVDRDGVQVDEDRDHD